MINLTLYTREMKVSLKLLLIFAALITLYVTIIVGMYDPQMMETLDSFYDMMPELMRSVGMTAGETTLMGFMISYLYGFILLIFPMVFCILRANGLIAQYVDQGSMVTLVASPVKRSTIALTQMGVLLTGILLLVGLATGLEYGVAALQFPGALQLSQLLALNGGLLCLHLFIGSICFLASCLFSDTKFSLAFGAGIPAVMYILTMLANAGEQARAARYFSLFTLFDPKGIVAGDTGAVWGVLVLLLGALVLYSLSVIIFSRKDLHI